MTTEPVFIPTKNITSVFPIVEDSIKKALKYTKKVNMIADGIRLSEMRRDI